jgi:hypothetical protein
MICGRNCKPPETADLARRLYTCWRVFAASIFELLSQYASSDWRYQRGAVRPSVVVSVNIRGLIDDKGSDRNLKLQSNETGLFGAFLGLQTSRKVARGSFMWSTVVGHQCGSAQELPQEQTSCSHHPPLSEPNPWERAKQ